MPAKLPANVYFQFPDENRPSAAQAGDQISLLVVEISAQKTRNLDIAVDYRHDHPNSIELQGDVTYDARRYRATIIINAHAHHLDSVTLICHP